MKLQLSAVITVTAMLAVSSIAFAEDWKAPAAADGKKNPVALDAASIAAGKKVWMKECASCHGNAGKGDGEKSKELPKSPGDLSDPAKMGAQSDGALFWKVTTGHPPMPPFVAKLSDEQRWQTVNYMRSISKGKAADEKTSETK
jgi:mono/diheme cytochrome c family protein